MPFPPGVQTVTLTGHQTLADGAGLPVPIRIRPVPTRVVGAGWGVVVDSEPVVVTPDNAGQWQRELVATDADGFDPTGWTYRVETGNDAFHIALPASLGTVDLADLIDAGVDDGEYIVRPGVTHPTDGPPAAGLGMAGDWALDVGARRLYGPRGGSAWPAFSVVPAPSEAGWSRAGFAALAGDDLYLTHAADGFGAGSSWYGSPQPTDGLDVTFECEMSGGSGADGVCFALADPATPTSFVGGGGGDLGLTGCTAVALALDTGGGPRARIVTTDADSMDTVATYGGALTLRPAPVVVRVRYAAGAVSVWVDGTQIFNAVAVAAPSSARVGWTGSNGGLTDDHIVRAVSFVPRGGMLL
jgi:hypothetical protein